MVDDPRQSPDPDDRARRRPYNVYTAVGLVIAVSAAAAYYLLYTQITAPPEIQPAVARLSAVVGDVSVKSGSGAWTPAEEGALLRMDDQVRTAAAAGAQISFSNGNVVRVRPDSIVLIGDLANPLVEQGQASWRIQSGAVSFDAEQSLEIQMANATARAQANSSGAVNVGAVGDAGIRIFKGSAEVTTREGDTVTLNSNEGVQVSPEGRAGPKLALPEAPVLIAPATQTELPFVEAPDVTARLSWQAVSLGRTYHLAVDYNVVHADLLLSAGLDQAGLKETSRELRELDLGKYYWRVAAVNEAGMEGDFSRVALFTIIEPPEPEVTALPILTVESVELLSNVVHVKGRTHPAAAVTVNGHPVKVQPDGSFSEYFQAGTSLFVIQVTGPDGQVVEETRRAVAAVS